MLAKAAGPAPVFLTKDNMKDFEWTTMFAPKDFKATFSVDAKQ